ncbi:uncharacterized protein LOC132255649 [Phlebotomus argentipes]|uniref:uncharacterized protein LOC132255649 n=1 Tax=Phlebotomus argentipes TaxID=94469 RepID=UPI0028929D27|nr:uncharacterized protein LOC132255649 [Phlebotomus argentipes]
MASVIGYSALLLLSFSFAMGNISISRDFKDIFKLEDFIRKIIESEKSTAENLFNYNYVSVQVNDMKSSEVLSVLKEDETRKDRKLLRTGKFTVKNNGNSEAKAKSQSYTYKKVHTDTISITQTKGFSGGIKLPFIDSFSPTVTFSNTQTTTQTDSVEESVTIPPQEVHLGPKSQKVVKYELYREELEQKFNLEFTVDPNATFNVIRTFVTPSIFPVKNTKTFKLIDFLRKAHANKNEFKDSHFIKYDYKTNKLMIKNFTAVRNVVNDDVEVTLGEEEPLK